VAGKKCCWSFVEHISIFFKEGGEENQHVAFSPEKNRPPEKEFIASAQGRLGTGELAATCLAGSSPLGQLRYQ
jgi:hypothetical protein